MTGGLSAGEAGAHRRHYQAQAAAAEAAGGRVARVDQASDRLTGELTYTGSI